MARKKTRAIDGSTESTNSPEKYDSKGNCPHLVKGVDIGGLKKAWKKKEGVTCQLCKKKQIATNKKTAGVENDLWVCMNCGHVGCGNTRHDHGMDHYNTPHSDCHSVVAVVDTWTLRCLQCRLDINLEVNSRASDSIAFLKKNLVGSSPVVEVVEDMSSQYNRRKSTPGAATDNKAKPKFQREEKIYPILGLENLGNTCYLNAVLQCLAQTPGFVDALESCCRSRIFHLSGSENTVQNDHGDYVPSLEGNLAEGGQLTKAVYRVLHHVRNGTCQRKSGMTNESPGDIIRLMKKLSNTFHIGEQHDSHEFLRFLMEGLRTEDLKRYQKGILIAMNISTAAKEVLPKQRELLIAYKNQALQNKLVIEQIFSGLIVSILKCVECDCITTTFESFMDISLPVESEKTKDVDRPASVDKLELRVSKYQQKKERKMARRSKKKPRVARAPVDVSSAQATQKNNHSSNESGTESEADVEDNLDGEPMIGSLQEDSGSVKTDSVTKFSSSVNNSNQGSDCFDQGNYKDAQCKTDPMLYPYTGLIFSPKEKKTCARSCSPDVSAILTNCPEPSSDMNDCNEEHPTVAYFCDSPVPWLNEDFGSCEGGRGSPASSIEQAHWEVFDEYKSECGPMAHECNNLADGIEKAMHISLGKCSADLTSEPFEYVSGESFKEELVPKKSPSNCDIDIFYDNLNDGYLPLCDSSFIVPESPEAQDKEISDEGLTPKVNQESDMIDADKQVIPDEAFESLVEEVVGFENNDAEEPEGVVSGNPSNNLSGSMDISDSSEGTWGITLAPPSELESMPYSLEHCLRQFFVEEVLSGANRIGCEQCTKRKGGREPKAGSKLVLTNALKQLLFMKLPEVLTFHLKRFEVVGSRMSKITRNVSFPMELDVSPYTSSKVQAQQPNASPYYHLYGVIEHTGHMSSGHYVAYVKVIEKITDYGDQPEVLSSPDPSNLNDCKERILHEIAKYEGMVNSNSESTAKWYYVSDTHVKEVTVNELMSCEAYILFYRKVN